MDKTIASLCLHSPKKKIVPRLQAGSLFLVLLPHYIRIGLLSKAFYDYDSIKLSYTCVRGNTLLPLQMGKVRLREPRCFCRGRRGWELVVSPCILAPSLPGNPRSAFLSASFKNLHYQPKDLYFLITLAAFSE